LDAYGQARDGEEANAHHIASYWPDIATPTPRTDPRDRPMARPSDARLLCIL
jgi:hypothetical protein